ncbi:NAD(P)-binding protein [Xylariaceae sp. FL0804]|nr:NAD(P)-binding protein [Xylariaceae sp. FL0804]
MALRRVRDHISQTWPPRPKFTEKDIGSLAGKVYVVTGANSGVGKEVARILYSKDARIYATARSEEKGLRAIEDIKKATPSSKGELKLVKLDLADLTGIKASAQEILSSERNINVLFNNAGVMTITGDRKTAQGYEEQLGVNNVGTHLFTQCLKPALISTARTEQPGAVRVVWLSSSGAEASPTGGVPMHNLDYHEPMDNFPKYAISKAGVYYQGAEFARRHEADGIISMPVHPGLLNSELFRNAPALLRGLFKVIFTYPLIYGAYTELWAGLSPEVTMAQSGRWVVPWGRFMEARPDLYQGTKSEEEGGTGIANEFWDWNQRQIEQYL